MERPHGWHPSQTAMPFAYPFNNRGSMGTIAKQPDERLIEFLQRELGDGLRTVSRFDADGCEPLFVRDDLRHARAGREITGRCEQVVAHIEAHQIDSFAPPSADDIKWLLGLVGEVVVLLLYRNESEGIVVSIDHTVDLPITSFIDDCVATLR